MHVLIHIGPYKTGSTALQHGLRAAQAALAQRGCYYFDEPEMPEFALQTLALTTPEQMVPDLRHRFGSLAAAQTWSESCWQRLEAEVAARRPLLTVISSEHFSGLADPAPLIARLRHHFDRITLLAYLRDPASLYLSTLQQRIRGNGDRLQDLPSPLRFSYPVRRQLAPYAKLLGPANMRVRRFAPPRDSARTQRLQAGRGWDVVADFASVLGALEPGLPPDLPACLIGGSARGNPPVNPSLPAALITWLACQNEALEPPGPGPARHRMLARLLQVPAVQALPRLRFADATLPALITAQARPVCAWANQNFLQGQAPLPLDGPPATDPTAPDPTPAEHAAAQHQLRDWLLAQLTPEAVQILGRALLHLPPP